MLKVNKQNYEFGAQPSAIRELYAYGLKRGEEVGYENIFDFSLGNPNVDLPDFVMDSLRSHVETPEWVMHCYTENAGYLPVREKIADVLSESFGQEVSADRLIVTCGAAAAVSITLSALLSEPTDEVIVLAPYFPEYKVWIEFAGGKCVEVMTNEDDFSLNVHNIAAAINENTRGIIVNSPNNPSGAVYSEESLKELSALLSAKQKEFGNPIYLIADEPYRELAYGVDVPHIPTIYRNTIVCYSLSKTFSIPGERIGFIYVNDKANYAEDLYTAMLGASRAHGYVCAPTTFQRVFLECYGRPIDIKPYEKNREDIMAVLDRAGFKYVRPQGAFYIMIQAPDGDAEMFKKRAMKHDILIVPSTSFGINGWCRAGFCVSNDIIRRSEQAFKELAEEYGISS